MMRLKNILCVMIITCASLFIFACNDYAPSSNDALSFSSLKTVVEQSKEISDRLNSFGYNTTSLKGGYLGYKK